METELLIDRGNQCRADRNPRKSLEYYAQAFVQDPDSFSAWNNYGNVMRELGYPLRALPFLEHAIAMDPSNPTAQFNRAVSLLLAGDYQRGWAAYESRWNYEHLAGTLPQYTQPRWTGQDPRGKTILVIGEQGLGDNIQFSRFLHSIYSNGGKVIFQVPPGLVSLFAPGDVISETVSTTEDITSQFDYWTPVMSLPVIFNVTLDNLPRSLGYIVANQLKVKAWKQFLGTKTKPRIGISWSGRRDTWINLHKAMPFEYAVDLISRNPEHQWINLQVDATDEEASKLDQLGVSMFPGAIADFSDTAALISNMDLVISIDTAIAHCTGALGIPLWVPLNNYAVDWRWLLNRNDSPWYPSAVLYRQPVMDDWASVVNAIDKNLKLVKI